MTFQLPLIVDDPTKKQTLLQDIAPDECIISRFNTRKTRPQEDIEKLAERIRQNGFELTRAPWAYRNGSGTLEVFAGGTRLEAAQLCQILIPIILFEGYTDEEIARLEIQDNEDDEYHIEVPLLDVWANYAYLHDKEGWTQQQIADAKGIDRSFIGYRLKLHSLPNQIKEFVNQKLLTETHLIEITKLGIDSHFVPWLTTEQAWQELAELAVRGIRKDGKKTTRATAKDVEGWKKFIAEADRTYQGLKAQTLYHFPKEGEPETYIFDAPVEFVQELTRREARTISAVKEAARIIRLFIKENLAAYEKYVQEKSAEAARVAIRAEKEKEILGKFILGDCLDKANLLELQSVRLLLTDPPYGQDYQSNRRWRSETPPKLDGDKPDEAMALFSAMLEVYQPVLVKDAHLLVFCNCQGFSDFRKALEDAGFKFIRDVIWVKEEHSAGDLEGSFAPSHEHIIHAVQGRPSVEPRIRDVIECPRDLQAPHPTAKPVPLLEKLILSCTHEGDLVVDPLAGWASTLMAAWNLDRDFWGCEIDPQWHDDGCARLLEKLEDVFDGDQGLL